MAERGKVAREAVETGLMDAGRVHAGNEEDGALGRQERTIATRRQLTATPRHRETLVTDRLQPEVGDPARHALHA